MAAKAPAARLGQGEHSDRNTSALAWSQSGDGSLKAPPSIAERALMLDRSHPRLPFAAWTSAFLLAVALLAPAVEAAPAPKWTIVDLGALGPRGSIPLAINNRGDIGGYSAAIPTGTPYTYFHAFLWQNGTMSDLGAQFGDGRVQSQASALNDHGVMVISKQGSVYTWQDGTFTSLGFSGTANDINKSGAIVGSTSAGSTTSAYVYRDGVLQVLDSLGGTYMTANAINDKGVAVGSGLLADGSTRGFAWENGTITQIPTLGGPSSSAVDINSHGEIVGTAQDASGNWLAYIRDRNGLRALSNVPAGAAVFAINDRGVVLGSYPNANHQGQTQFLWDDGVVTTLDQIPEVKAAGWASIFVTDMNDHGWITGWGWKTGGSLDGEAFLLTPK
jgi:probable HAF family extracellular repeat protein